MADREDEELQMALRMSLQGSPPEAKRSKPRETAEESVDARNRRLQRELLASAAEKRMKAVENKSINMALLVSATEDVEKEGIVSSIGSSGLREDVILEPLDGRAECGRMELDAGAELSPMETKQLFSMIFGDGVSKNILLQWCNQGIRFSSDPETCIGLVQHEGGPCGVLATIQAFVLKYLLFFSDDLNKCEDSLLLQSPDSRRFCQSSCSSADDFASTTEDRKARALVLGMLEILFSCGSKERAIVATLGVSSCQPGEGSEGQTSEMMMRYLDGLSIESASDLQRVLRIKTYTSHSIAFQQLLLELPIFQSRIGALLFLISALLSRGLESIQADRDDPSLPLVTAPFGHASQEIVNLLLSGQAVPNVFDGRMDLGGGLSLKGISTSVEVGFLTLLESLNLCKVGRHLKCPKWPIWVVGSESHYTVLFALEPSVQEENELEERESRIRRAFDAQDQSGGGGFISYEALQQVLKEHNISFPTPKLESLYFSGFIVWSEFLQELLELDKSLGGLKDSSGSMGKKLFDIYHFNGIAKSVLNGNVGMGGEIPLQRPRLCKLCVSVPPRWTQEEFLSVSGENRSSEASQSADSSQHAPLVDCIRTRWPRAVCCWAGDAPSIV